MYPVSWGYNHLTIWGVPGLRPVRYGTEYGEVLLRALRLRSGIAAQLHSTVAGCVAGAPDSIPTPRILLDSQEPEGEFLA